MSHTNSPQLPSVLESFASNVCRSNGQAWVCACVWMCAWLCRDRQEYTVLGRCRCCCCCFCMTSSVGCLTVNILKSDTFVKVFFYVHWCNSVYRLFSLVFRLKRVKIFEFLFYFSVYFHFAFDFWLPNRNSIDIQHTEITLRRIEKGAKNETLDRKKKKKNGN